MYGIKRGCNAEEGVTGIQQIELLGAGIFKSELTNVVVK